MKQTIICGDCQHYNTVEEYDLAMFDPPFDLWGYHAKKFNALKKYADENGLDCKFGPNAKTIVCFTNFQNRHHVVDLFGNPKFEMIWHFKDGRWVSNKMPRHTHEHILIYGELRYDAFTGEINDNQKPIKKGKGSIGKDKNLGDRTYHPKERKMLNSVIEVPRNVGKELGVWGKPIDLIMPIMEWLTEEGESVWDGFAGSGTFGCVAKALNLEYIGYEIKQEVATKAQNRIRNFSIQKRGLTTLFDKFQ